MIKHLKKKDERVGEIFLPKSPQHSATISETFTAGCREIALAFPRLCYMYIEGGSIAVRDNFGGQFVVSAITNLGTMCTIIVYYSSNPR